ncbi:helix-turn-helix domain-containing protein [Virgibacillus sp. NKC19-3]|uniref:helix-turn-helix domain-containing protein n=1 Tax=Virgibacillus saliphilus TaxID=2831674 RepID=UPI001C9AD7FE|nr:helix-turn-helix domain-containing protein [Virgibacillus sp. NKC19-3]MBY7141575.1 helix-turn-helix domain-containing protein [Virgibacillus sp. NKC19-3]
MPSECKIQCCKEQLENEEVEKIIKELSPRIKNSITNTAYQEREDLEQELAIKIIEKIQMFECRDSPGFWDFVQSKQ